MKAMKYLLPVLIGTIVQTAMANDKPTAICHLEKAHVIETYQFFKPHTAESYVIIEMRFKDDDEVVSRQKAPTDFHFTSWIHYGGVFMRHELAHRYVFSNYESPSVGKMYIGGKPHAMNCELL